MSGSDLRAAFCGRSVQVGSGKVIPGFDAAVTGLQAGDTRTQRVPPEQGYGAFFCPFWRSCIQITLRSSTAIQLLPARTQLHESMSSSHLWCSASDILWRHVSPQSMLRPQESATRRQWL